MIFVAVVHIVVEIFVECGSLHLPVGIWDGDDFMLRKLHSPSLMDVDMTAAHTNDALILIEHRVDGGGVGLGASRQEEDLGIGYATGFPDAVLSPFAELVEAIWCRLGVVVLHQIVNYLLAGTVIVVTFKGYHIMSVYFLPAKLHKVSRFACRIHLNFVYLQPNYSLFRDDQIKVHFYNALLCCIFAVTLFLV